MGKIGDPQSYDHLAEHYEHMTALEGDPVGDWLPSVLPESCGSALDVGCGAGRHALALAERFERVVAVDLSESMIQLARARRPRQNIEYRVCDVYDVSGRYDFVFSSAMLHHVKDLALALAHIRDLVAPGGRSVLVDVSAPSRSLYRLSMGIAPRTVLRTSALMQLMSGRFSPEARERFRLSWSRPWLEHVATDRFLTAREFDDVYGRAFPGAAFVDVSFFRACVWNAPAP